MNPFFVKEVHMSVSFRELITNTFLLFTVTFDPILTPDTFIYSCCIFKIYFLEDLMSTWQLY